MRTVRAQIKFYSLHKGYGFLISPEIEGDIFFHATALQADGWTRIDPFQEVMAQVKFDAKGWRAHRLVPAGKHEARDA